MSSSVHGKEAAHFSGVSFNQASGDFEGITNEQMAQWSDDFPGVNVHLAVTSAACQLICGPSKRAESEALPFLVARFRRLQRQAEREAASMGRSVLGLVSGVAGDLAESREAIALASGSLEVARAALAKFCGPLRTA